MLSKQDSAYSCTYLKNRNKTITTKSKNTKKKTYTKQTKSKKIYQKFSNNIKLISDSRIKKLSNNKLTSNSQIYGRFYPKEYSVINPSKNQISNVRCGLKQNLYNVVDECSMNISNSFDKVYLGKMRANDIKNFDRKKYMIECNYSRTHGIMHDCRKKMLM